MISVAKIRLDPPKSTRLFKGIICDDISEFESYMPSHAVRSPSAKMRSCPADRTHRDHFDIGDKAISSNASPNSAFVCHLLLVLLSSATGDRCRRNRLPTASAE